MTVYPAAVMIITSVLMTLGCTDYGVDRDDAVEAVADVRLTIPLGSTFTFLPRNTTFPFGQGIAAFGTAGRTTVTFVSSTAATITESGSTASASVTFGRSCTFIITGGTVGQLNVGDEILVTTCELLAAADDVVAGGPPVEGTARLRLGADLSEGIPTPISRLDEGSVVIGLFDEIFIQ
jgi:hypothetical protein